MTDKPSYVVHEVKEKDVTVDWFFGDRTLRQEDRPADPAPGRLVLRRVPVVITASALTTETRGGWWGYPEGFACGI